MLCPECSFKIEAESILCPRCAVKGDFPAPSERVCDIFLMGFSDPSSFDRLIEDLLQHSFRDSREDLLARLSNPPTLITKGMEAGRARLLRKELEELGGIIEVRERQMKDRGSAKKILREGELEMPAPSPSEAPTRGGRGYLVLFLISMAAVVYLAYYHDFSRERNTVQRAVRKITSHFPGPSSQKEIPKPSVGEAQKVTATSAMNPEGVRMNNEGISFMDQGRYEDAVKSFQAALSLIPGEATILQNLQRAWIQQGYRSLEKKEYEKSISFFEEAVKVLDRSPEVYKLMGMAALNLPDENRAVEYFRTYFDRVPDDPEVARILGEILYKQNRLEEGIRFLRIYLAADPGDERVRKIVEKAGREAAAEQGFETHEAEHFDVRYNGMENLEAQYLVVAILEDAYQRIGAELNYYPPDRLVTILYSNEDFRNVTQTPDWARGLYDGKIRIPVGGLTEKNETLERVVAHEYTHALVHEMVGGRVPTWLNEGLAQYFEGEPAGGHTDNVGYILRTQDFIPLKKLEGSFLGMDAETAAIAYTESYTLVDLIIQEHGIYAIQKLLSEIGDGADMESALRAAVGMDYTGLQDEWLRYLAQKYSEFHSPREYAGIAEIV